jgi:hypothetical protein
MIFFYYFNNVIRVFRSIILIIYLRSQQTNDYLDAHTEFLPDLIHLQVALQVVVQVV